MRKFSQKTRIIACFFAAVALFVYSCLESPDFGEFIEDEDVMEFVDKINVSVGLTDDSDSGLTGGVNKVSGLVAGRYYKVEKKNDDGTFTFSGYVKSDGTLSLNIIDISRAATGMEITGLINDVTYRVVSAKAVDAIDTVSSASASPSTVAPVNGVVNLSPTSNTNITINLPAKYDSSYNKVRVPSPTGTNIVLNAMNVTMTVNQTAEFVFYNDSAKDFRFLRIVVGSPPKTEITISFTMPGNNAPAFNPNSVTMSRGDIIGGTAPNISVPGDFASIQWRYDGSDVTYGISDGGKTFNINEFFKDGIGFGECIPGSAHTFSVLVVKDSVSYSAIFTVNIIN